MIGRLCRPSFCPYLNTTISTHIKNYRNFDEILHMIKSLLFLPILCLLTSVQSGDQTQILAQMKKYDEAVKTMNIDGVIKLYEPDGMFGDVKGHEAIRKYLTSFSKTKVLGYVSTTDKIIVTSGLATHTGTFIQEVISNGSNKVYNGAFRIIWSKNKGEWKIKFMSTELDYTR